jgi:beta-mannanase/chitodextrinase
MPVQHPSLAAVVRRSLRPVLAAAVLSGLFAGYSAVSPPETAVLAAGTASVLWGSYVDGAPFNTALIDQFETDAGKKQSIIHWGQPWQMNGSMQSFQTQAYETVRLRGSIPMVNWNSWNLGVGVTDPNYTLAKVYTGTYDAYITRWAQDAKAWGHPFFIRFNHEMNGSWYSWSEQKNGNQPGDYVKAWRHVVDIFRSVGATNATWVWCVNITSSQTTPLTALYPGDNYVDWTSMDGYNKATGASSWLSSNQIFGLNPWSQQNTYQQLVNLAPSKPIMVAETATTTTGGDAGAWINDALQTQIPVNFPRVKALVWFNWNDNDPTLPYPIESTPGQQAAFKQSIASSVYAANTFAALPAGPVQAPGAPGDTVAPSAPASVTATGTSATQIALSWTASTDNVGVVGYNVFRDGSSSSLNAALLTGTTFTDTNLAQISTHSYTLRAQDAAGNPSSLSALASATTLDTQVPTPPTSVIATGPSSTQITLTWAPATDNVGVTGYNVFRSDGTLINTSPVTATTFTDTGLLPKSTHYYVVRALDAAGNRSSPSSMVNATTKVAPETQAPTQPTNLIATGTSTTQIALSWTASTDNVGVVGYNIFRDGATTPTNTALVTATTYTDIGLAASSAHSYTVQALDGVGNKSPLSTAASATTQTPAPVSPLVLLPAATRLADTRSTAPVGPIGAGTSRCFTVAGQAGIPMDATGVLVNLTAIGPTGQGWLTLFPNGQAVPGTSTLNFAASQFAIANNATVRIGTNGQVCVNAGQTGTNVLLDAVGYIPSASAAMMPLLTSPARLADTRGAGGAIAANTSRCFAVAGQSGIPTTATGVLLNITSVGYTGSGWLTTYPAGQAVPATSTLNFDTREWAIANNTYAKLGTGGQVCVAAGQSASQVIIDAVGYLTADGVVAMPLLASPQRLVYTVSSGGAIAAGTSRCFTIAGQHGIPTNVKAVLLNLTATGYTADGTLTVYANGLSAAGLPATVSFDSASETAIPNGTLVPLGSGGQLCISAGQASAQAIVDVTGYIL